MKIAKFLISILLLNVLYCELMDDEKIPENVKKAKEEYLKFFEDIKNLKVDKIYFKHGKDNNFRHGFIAVTIEKMDKIWIKYHRAEWGKSAELYEGSFKYDENKSIEYEPIENLNIDQVNDYFVKVKDGYQVPTIKYPIIENEPIKKNMENIEELTLKRNIKQSDMFNFNDKIKYKVRNCYSFTDLFIKNLTLNGIDPKYAEESIRIKIDKRNNLEIHKEKKKKIRKNYK